jgi:hypothetical protein
MRTATLFADESGDFDSADEQAFVVAGLLVGGADSPRGQAVLRERIEAALPGVPWPPHATELRRPGGWLRAQPGAADPALQRALDQARAALVAAGELQPESLSPSGAGSLYALDDVLRRRSTGLYQLIGRLIQPHLEAVAALLGELSDQGDVWGIAAIARRDDPAPWVEGLPYALDGLHETDDRWLQLNEVLVERAALAVGLAGGQRLHMRAEHRLIRTRGGLRLPGARARHALARATASGLPELPAKARPTLVCIDDPRRLQREHPGVVLADWVANRVRAAVRKGRAQPEGLGGLRFELPLQPEAPGLPLRVAANDSRRWLRSPERRATTPCPTVFGHSWATATLPHLPAAAAATPERR